MAGELEHPGSWIGDSVEEFKKLPPAGKVAVGAGVIGVIAFAWYEHNKAANSAATLPATGVTATGAGIPSGATDPTVGGTTTGGGTATGGTGNTPVDPPIKPPILPGGPPVKTPPPPQPKLQYYTVVHGDNLSEIAAKLGIKGGWQALYNQNKSVIGSNPNLIYAGQKYNITGLR